jgi:hypothetical protein
MAAATTDNQSEEMPEPKAKDRPSKKSTAMKKRTKKAKKKAAKKPVKRGDDGARSKSDEIRRVATFMQGRGEKPRPSLIVKELKQQGIDVAPAQVSLVLKKMGFRPLRKRKGAKRAAPRVASVKPSVARGVVSVDDLLAAKKAAAALGGTGKAIAALQALKRFED